MTRIIKRRRKKKLLFLISLVLFVGILSILNFVLPLTYSKYTETVKHELSLNIREPQYTIVFNSNSGTGSMSNQQFIYSVAQNLTSNSFIKTGYKFTGWNTEADGTGTGYTNSQSVDRLTEVDGDVINLYARWEPITYTVHFDANTGTGTMTDQTFTYDVSNTLSSNSFTKSGFLFDGWNTVADGSGTRYSNEEQVSNLTSVDNDVINLYAQWSVEDTSLTITNFNTGISPIQTGTELFGLRQVGYKVLGITIQNNHPYSIDNWTVEFNSNRQVETTRPTNNQLSAYLNPENFYGSISQSGNTVTVSGTDTLAPGESKTVYVFFDWSKGIITGETTYNFTNQRAYYTPSGRRNAPARKLLKTSLPVKLMDESSFDDVEVHLVYDTTIDENGIYLTNIVVFIMNNTENDISNVGFDVTYNSLNTSKLSSEEIKILSDDENGALFLSEETIPKGEYKYYTVTGMETRGEFNGMDISNIIFESPELKTEIEDN